MSEVYNKSMYLVVSQSGSIVSKIIKLVTRAPYNHVAISLNRELKPMYSFARVKPWNPVIGGYVAESAGKGTLKRFPDTQCIVPFTFLPSTQPPRDSGSYSQ